MPFYSQHPIQEGKKWLCCCKKTYVSIIHCKPKMILYYGLDNNGNWFWKCDLYEKLNNSESYQKMESSVNVKSSLLRNITPGLFRFAFVACHAWMKVLHSQGAGKPLSVVYFLNPTPPLWFLMSDLKWKACKYNDYHMDKSPALRMPCFSILTLAVLHMSHPLCGWILTWLLH